MRGRHKAKIQTVSLKIDRDTYQWLKAKVDKEKTLSSVIREIFVKAKAKEGQYD